MAVTISVYGLAQKHLGSGDINLASDTIKGMLTTNTYTPNQDTDEFRSAVTNEVTGTGYSAGGVALTGKALTYDGATNTEKWDATDLTFTAVSITARRLVLYKSRGGASSADELICWVDFGADQTRTAQDLVIQWSGSGILTFSTA